ncbi:MAG: hypothetical protein LC748_09190, partial [Thermomicrobia bacterium]|nr:hypothetical protein [Thermomicrobia bacterium]
LQKWIAQHPPLLAGDQMNAESPRRWILIGAELAIPSELDGSGRWPIDHLFVDQDAIPTIVETKRSSNPEIRRQVVGQMIDYAANSIRYLPISSIRSYFQATCMKDKCEPSEKLTGLLGPDADAEQFWELVESNLKAGRIRLVFVGDVIPPELRRAVEYLNDQMRDAEVLAVEVKQFKGEGVTTLVPRVIGQTERAQQKKTMSTTVEKRHQSVETFFAELTDARPPDEVSAVTRFHEWATEYSVECKWGTSQMGMMTPIVTHKGVKHYFGWFWTNGKIYVDFRDMRPNLPSSDLALREELQRRLEKISGIPLPPNAVDRQPSINMSAIATEDGLAQFLDTFAWYVDTIRSS